MKYFGVYRCRSCAVEFELEVTQMRFETAETCALVGMWQDAHSMKMEWPHFCVPGAKDGEGYEVIGCGDLIRAVRVEG